MAVEKVKEYGDTEKEVSAPAGRLCVFILYLCGVQSVISLVPSVISHCTREMRIFSTHGRVGDSICPQNMALVSGALGNLFDVSMDFSFANIRILDYNLY